MKRVGRWLLVTLAFLMGCGSTTGPTRAHCVVVVDLRVSPPEVEMTGPCAVTDIEVRVLPEGQRVRV